METTETPKNFRHRTGSNSGTPKSERDEWCTPNRIIKAFDPMGIAIDLATNENNPLGVDRFYTSDNSALDYDWFNGGLHWCNPPFSLKKQFLNKAASKDWGAEVVMLLPASTGAAWFKPAFDAKAICFVQGREKFINPQTMKPHKDAAMFDIVLVYWGHRVGLFGQCAGMLGRVVYL